MQPAPEGVLLFTERSLWTMIHGIGLGGGALLALSAALFSMFILRASHADAGAEQAHSRGLIALIVFLAVMVWLTTLVGTYTIFPDYRATPPEGTSVLTAYPRSLILSNPETAWLHAYAMETKEHVPWIAVMFATAVAFVAARYRSQLLSDHRIRQLATWLLAICFLIVAYVSLLGVFINKVAPLE